MAYRIQRKSRILETMEVCNAKGDVDLTLTVDIDVDKIIARWNKVYVDLAQAKIAENPDRLGDCTCLLLELVFGAEQATRLLEYYEQRYSELLLDVFPFIAEVITPQINAASAARKEQMLAASKAVRRLG